MDNGTSKTRPRVAKKSFNKKQSKERRENAKGKELADLKKENNQLKRQVSRLTKQITRTLSTEADKEEPEVASKEEAKLTCKSCGHSPVKKVSFGSFSLLVCTACNWRTKEND